MKGLFGKTGGRNIDKDMMRMMAAHIDEAGESDFERQIAIDFKHYEDLKFDDDLDSDKE